MPSSPLPHARHLLAAAALAALHGGALAQTAATATTTAGKLEPITITAERRAENIRDVPSSVSTLQGEMLDVMNTSGQDVRMLAGRVPSLNVESSFGRAFPRFYIRGYGNTDFRSNASQPVSLVYDDVVQETPILKGFPLFDLDRVEVLRGPQGSLFGRNTPAGVVKFDSARPTRKMEGYGSLSFGSLETINAEAAINVPMGSTLAMRTSVLNQTRRDWVDNTLASGPTQHLEGYRDSALRTQLLWEPGADISVLGNVHARDFRGSARLFRANIIQPGTNNIVANFDERRIATDGQNRSELQNYGANLRVRFGLGGGLTLNSITGFEQVQAYSRGDIDGGYGAAFAPPSGPGVIPFSSETAGGIPKHAQYSQEFRLESAAGTAFGWQAGVFLFREDIKIDSYSYNSLAGGAQNGFERVQQVNDAYAVFAAANLAVTSDIKLRGGLRFTHDKKTFSVLDYNSAQFGTPATLAALAAGGPLSASPRDNKLSYDASGTWTVAPAVNLYARVATGFRASSVQGAGFFNAQSVATPETNLSTEVGVKADLFDRRVRLAFDVFRYTVKDLQLTAVGGASNANILLNARKATGQGFELDLQGYLTERLLATVGVGYNDTEIKDANLAVSVCASCTVTDPKTAAGKALINGNPLPQAPKTTASFTLKYTQPVGNGELYAFTDWVYRGKVNFFLYESTEFTGRALTEGGLRLGYTWGGGKYDLAAYGRNITNQIRVVGGIDFNNLTGFINDPRTVGMQFKATF